MAQFWNLAVSFGIWRLPSFGIGVYTMAIANLRWVALVALAAYAATDAADISASDHHFTHTDTHTSAHLGQLQPVIHTSATRWDRSQALAEVSTDVANIAEDCATLRTASVQDIHDYANTRSKSPDRPRDVSRRVLLLVGILSLPLGDDIAVATRASIYAQILELAVAINGTFTTMIPFAEGVTMRGWPFRIGSNSTTPEFEAYQAGYLMRAVALAAEQAARVGDHGTAASLALAVAAALQDGFLTANPERTKVGPSGVVYVPETASAGRRERYGKMHPGWPCVDQPQALNHGESAAAAAIALLQACRAIDWTKAKWGLVDAEGSPLNRFTFLTEVEAFVASTAQVLLHALKECKTGSSSLDRYAGVDGTAWYLWQYKDVSECPEAKTEKGQKSGHSLARWEDTTHMRYELSFAKTLRAVGHDLFGRESYFGVERKHIRGLLVTMLNRLIADRGASGGARFACDISGNTTDARQCSKERAEHVRHLAAAHSLHAAVAARDDPTARCDALSLVDAVLPLFTVGHTDFISGTLCGGKVSDTTLVLLEAKYYFYWHKNGLADCASNDKHLLAPGNTTRAALDNAEIHTISFAAGNPPGPHALLHVGPAKTGTTHLQAFFATNAQRLKSYGWTYPSLFGESCRAQTTARLESKSIWSGSLRYVLKPCHQQTQDHEVCGASTIDKERTQLALARQLGRECTNIDSALRRTLATGDDAAVEAVILQWWKDEFARIAQSDAPNLIVSDEAFGNPDYAPLLAHAFKEAGYQRLSAVIVNRTPLLSWARSTYNQNMEGSRPTVEKHLHPPLLLFDEFVPQTVDALAEKLPVVVKAYRDEGFETMVIDDAGAKEKGFDQADVVACDIMRVPFCKESKWRSDTSTGESNSRSDYPNPIGNVAWAYYKAASGHNCSLPKYGKRGRFFRAMVSALVSAGCLGTQGQPPEYSCTDWAQVENRAVSMEMRWRTSATQVFHSLEKPLTEKIVLCSLNASYLLAKPDAKRVFRAFCTNEQAG